MYPNKMLITGLTGMLLFASASYGQVALDTDAQKLGYTIGMDIGNSLKQQGGDIDLDAMFAAVRDVYEGKDTQLTTAEATAIRQDFMNRRREAAAAEREQQAANNVTEGEAFLAENANKAGVTVTDSGLQYEVINAGDGDRPSATDRVTVNYRGTLLNGQEFDSSYSRGQPATFALNQVIPGWTEGVQLMPVGSTYKFYVPADLAYGERGAGQLIGPNATLIFDVELISIDSQDAQ